MELGHLDKHSPTTQERKTQQGKNLYIFRLETIKNFILNGKFYPQMTTIKTFGLRTRSVPARLEAQVKLRARKIGRDKLTCPECSSL